MKRIRFKNDQPASEKQISLVKSLVRQQQDKALDSPIEAAGEFWSRVEVPTDLTKWEASSLIITLRYGMPETSFKRAAMVIKDVHASKKINDSSYDFAMLAFIDAMKWLEIECKERGII